MKRRAATRLGVSLISLVVLTFAIPMLNNIWGVGSIILSAAGAPASASIAWTSANMMSAAIYAFVPMAAPLALFQIA